MDALQQLAHATEFTFYPEGAEDDEINGKHFRITVAKRSKGKWAVLFFGECWNGEDWVHEGMASSRGKDFLKVTRFDLNTALELAESLVENTQVNGLTYAGLQKKFKEHNLI